MAAGYRERLDPLESDEGLVHPRQPCGEATEPEAIPTGLPELNRPGISGGWLM